MEKGRYEFIRGDAHTGYKDRTIQHEHRFFLNLKGKNICSNRNRLKEKNL